MLSDSLVEQFRVRLAALGLELADLRIGGTPNRPLAQVRIEWPPADPGTPERRVTVEECARASRAQSSPVTPRPGVPRSARGPSKRDRKSTRLESSHPKIPHTA